VDITELCTRTYYFVEASADIRAGPDAPVLSTVVGLTEWQLQARNRYVWLVICMHMCFACNRQPCIALLLPCFDVLASAATQDV